MSAWPQPVGDRGNRGRADPGRSGSVQRSRKDRVHGAQPPGPRRREPARRARADASRTHLGHPHRLRVSPGGRRRLGGLVAQIDAAPRRPMSRPGLAGMPAGPPASGGANRPGGPRAGSSMTSHAGRLDVVAEACGSPPRCTRVCSRCVSARAGPIDDDSALGGGRENSSATVGPSSRIRSSGVAAQSVEEEMVAVPQRFDLGHQAGRKYFFP